jgi:hypothetical protein
VGRLSRWGEPGVSRVETERGMRRETPRSATLSVSATRSPLYQDDKKFRRKRRHGTAPRTIRVPAQRTRCPQRSGWVSQAVEGRCRKNDPTCRGQRACGRRCRGGRGYWALTCGDSLSTYFSGFPPPTRMAGTRHLCGSFIDMIRWHVAQLGGSS